MTSKTFNILYTSILRMKEIDRKGVIEIHTLLSEEYLDRMIKQTNQFIRYLFKIKSNTD